MNGTDAQPHDDDDRENCSMNWQQLSEKELFRSSSMETRHFKAACLHKAWMPPTRSRTAHTYAEMYLGAQEASDLLISDRLLASKDSHEGKRIFHPFFF